MQSIIQYRKFRRALEAQVERADRKSRSLDGDGKEQGRRQLPDQSLPGDSFSEKDVEKGNNTSQSSDDPKMGLSGADLQRQNSSGDPYPQQDVERRGRMHQQDQQPQHPTEEVEDFRDSNDEPPEWPGLPESLEHQPTNLSRVSTQTSQRGQRAGMHRTGTALGAVMTGVQIRKRSTKEGGDGTVFIVSYEDEDDIMNPHNWSYTRRIGITFMVAAIGFVVGFASAVDSAALPHAAAEFGVSDVVESLATGLYLIGFGVGALVAGPFSEILGRNPVYIVTMLLYMVFIMASGLSPNIGAQLIFRFLAGLFGSTPLTCAGGSLSDIWNPSERTWAFPVFANAAFLGPIMGPVVGGFIVQPGSALPSWRWTEWITLIISGVVLALVVLFLPETFPPILLKWKAKHLRAITGEQRYRAEVEVRQESFLTRQGRALYRPFLLTATEPIILLVALYLTVVYIILFTFLDGYTYIFADIHGTSEGITGLCFLGIGVGLFLATPLVFLIGHLAKKRMEVVRANGGDRLAPEFRLWFAMFGAPAIPISLFWMGWTSDSNISIWSPLVASVLFGFGILCVFISSYQYIIDSYEIFAASALASITLIRYVAAGAMTVVGIPFYQNLGVHYTLTILACISVACTPVPYVFYWYGEAIRRRSKYAPAQ